MIDEKLLRTYYLEQGKSVQEIATVLNCSTNKVIYWMDKYNIKRRSISDAIYQKHNPNGDPFTPRPARTPAEAKLLGLGLGLYWGEGNKANKYSVRLGNTDPSLILVFIKFLVDLFGIKREDLRFSLQLFSDIDAEKSTSLLGSTSRGEHLAIL